MLKRHCQTKFTSIVLRDARADTRARRARENTSSREVDRAALGSRNVSRRDSLVRLGQRQRIAAIFVTAHVKIVEERKRARESRCRNEIPRISARSRSYRARGMTWSDRSRNGRPRLVLPPSAGGPSENKQVSRSRSLPLFLFIYIFFVYLALALALPLQVLDMNSCDVCTAFGRRIRRKEKVILSRRYGGS